MSAEKIIEKILSEAQTQAANILEQSKLNAEEIMLEFKSKAELKKAAIEDQAEIEAKETHRRILVAAALDRRLELSAAKQALIDKSFDTALKQLSLKSGNELAEIAVKLAKDLLLQDGAKVLVSQQHAKQGTEMADALKNMGIVISVEPDSSVNGAGFVIKRGAIEDSFIFASMLRQNHEELLPFAAEKLFS